MRSVRLPSNDLKSVRLLLRRIGSLGALLILLVAIPPLADDPDLRGVVPGFLIVVYLYLAPALWTREPDLFAPPIYTGLMGSLATVSTLVFFMAKGRIELSLISGLSPAEQADLAMTTLIAIALGVIAYYAGYYHPRWGLKWRRMFPSRLQPAWDAHKLKLAAIGCAVIFVACYAFFQAKVGGPLFDPTRLEAGKAVWREDPTLSWMVRGVQLGVVPVLFYLALAASDGRWHKIALWVAVLGVVALLLLRLGQRGFLYAPLLCGVALLHFLKRRISIALFVAAMLLVVTANTIMLEWRVSYQVTTQGPLELTDAAERPGTVLAGHEEDRQRFAAMALVFHEFPENHDYLLGESWLALVAMPIPRWLWPSKAEHFQWRDTNVVKKLVGAPIPSNYTSMLYINFSWIGIVLGMMLWGAFQRGLYEWLRQDTAEPGRVLLYVNFLFFFAPTLLTLSAALQSLLPTYLILRFIGLRRRTTAVPITTPASAPAR